MGAVKGCELVLVYEIRGFLESKKLFQKVIEGLPVQLFQLLRVPDDELHGLDQPRGQCVEILDLLLWILLVSFLAAIDGKAFKVLHRLPPAVLMSLSFLMNALSNDTPLLVRLRANWYSIARLSRDSFSQIKAASTMILNSARFTSDDSSKAMLYFRSSFDTASFSSECFVALQIVSRRSTPRKESRWTSDRLAMAMYFSRLRLPRKVGYAWPTLPGVSLSLWPPSAQAISPRTLRGQ